MSRYPRLWLTCWLALLCPIAFAASAQPNFIFILADDLGYGDLGCYGQTRIPTPNIDRLAAEGARFTQFYAGSPVCAPSRNVLMTGQHTGHTTIRGNAKINLRPADVTVAQVLGSAGYFTALYGKWGLGAEKSTGTPLAKGFDAFFGYVDQTHAHNYYPTFLVRDDTRVPLRNVVPDEGPYGQGAATVRLDYSYDLITEESLAILGRQRSDRPFFFYLPVTLPHANDEAKADGMEVPDYGAFAPKPWPTPEKGYAAMVARLDRDVGRILALLKERGLDENTVVIFSSDNGPHREGGHDADFFDSRGPLRGYKRDLYEGGIRVPFIIRWPGHVAAGQTLTTVGSFADILPTFAALAGVTAPAGLDGIDLSPSFLGRPQNQTARDYLYWEFYEGRSAQAVRFDHWKAVRSPMLSGAIELYDLNTDLGEQHDLAATQPDLVAKARAYMEQAHVPSPLWKVPQ